MRECYNIPITNDDTQEDTETFTVTVNRSSGLDPRIRSKDNVAVVSIIDADSKRGRGRVSMFTYSPLADIISDAHGMA